MYTAVKAIGVKKGINQRWHQIPLYTAIVKTLYATYRKIYLTVTLDGNSTELYIDLNALQNVYNDFNDTVLALLLANGNNALETIPSIPNIDTKYIQYKDAHRALYSVEPTHPTYGSNAAPELKTALKLTRNDPTTDYSLFYNHCLVSVNGLFHLTDTNGNDGVIIYEGMESLRVSNQNQIGIMSFLNIGNLEFVPITESMVHKHDANQSYANSGYVKLNKDLTGKTVFLVLGGYLHTPESNLFSRVGNDEFKVDFSNYPLFDRYYESSHYLKLDSLGLSMTDRNPSQVAVEELLSDAVLLKYLTLSQSFFVIVDAPELFVNKQMIKKTGFPGMFVSYKRPKYPIVTGIGRCPEYWVVPEDGQYSLTVFDSSISRRIYNTTDPLGLHSLSDSNLPSDPEQLSDAYFLEIGRDI